MTAPLISVIVPVYNHELFVVDALESVLNQTNCNLQLIVIDDGSTDRSFEKVKAMSHRFPGGSIFFTRSNRGAHMTINEGLSLATGEFLTVLNSDDLFFEKRLDVMLTAMHDKGALFAFSEVEYIDAYGSIVSDDPYVQDLRNVTNGLSCYPTVGFALLKNNLAISTGNFIFHRSIYEKVGPILHYQYVHDWDYLLRCLFYTEPLMIPHKLYGYRVHGTNSFKSLADVAAYETSEVMRNCMHRLITRLPENKLAPSPHCWPGYFDRVIQDLQYQTYLPNGCLY